MKSGTVVGLQARIGVIFYPPDSVEVEIECVVDTGFQGFIALPPIVVADLRLPYVTSIEANLANNSYVTTSAHQATIQWNDRERTILVLAIGRFPLIGTALLEDYHLSIDFYEGGTVLVDEIL